MEQRRKVMLLAGVLGFVVAAVVAVTVGGMVDPPS